MSRAFMFEKDDMFHCNIKDRDCPDANLRGGCDLDKCRHDDESTDMEVTDGSTISNEVVGDEPSVN